ADYTWAAGIHTAVVTATGACGAPVTATHTVTVEVLIPTCPVPLTGVRITGPVTSVIGISYAFTATISPANATMPVTYTWTPTPLLSHLLLSGQSVVTYTWEEAGDYTITVTAENCGGYKTDARTVHIPAGQHQIYLPLILRAD
ncbi:MAG: PKD domain-containing protein, partial [Anaerolineae bacterium]|nr:PKD domain-containing protein [Anaerolineae bacterium]